MISKYIILGGEKTTMMFTPIVFPEHMQHVSVAERFGGKENVLSAGFIKVSVQDGDVKVTCWGESKSLGIKSDGENDARFIRIMLID
jgi:hypothetical protein